MKKMYTYCLMIWLATPAFAQYYPPSIQWQNSLGTTGEDIFEEVITTTDGGYIAAGRNKGNDFDVSDNHGGFDAFIVKYTSTGTVEWKKSFGGTLDDWAYSIKQTSDGGYIVAGIASSSNGDLNSNQGFADAWIFKISNIGSLQWQKNYGTTANDDAQAIQITSDGGYIFTGTCGGNNGDAIGSGFKGGVDVWVVKLSNTGIIQWQKAYGSTFGDFGHDISITNDGGYIIAGHVSGNDGDVSGFHNGSTPNRRDMWGLKLDILGNIQWQKCLGGGDQDQAESVKQTNDGGYIIAGYTGSMDGDVTNYHGGIRDGWVVKLSSNGNVEWQRAIGGSSDDVVFDIIKHPDGGFVLCGYTFSSNGDFQLTQSRGAEDGSVLKLSSGGDIQWIRKFGSSGSDWGVSIALTPDNGFIICGKVGKNDFDATGNIFHGANPDCWIVKLSAQVLPVTLIDFKLKQITEGIVLLWQTANEVNFGHFEIERSTNGNAYSAIGSVASNGDSRSNQFYSFTDTDNPSVTKLYYRLKVVDIDGSYTYSSVVTARLEDQATVIIFPNPVESLLNIRSDKPVKQLTISDAAGRIYFVGKAADIKSINTSNLPAGTYYLQLFDVNNETRLFPFIKK